MIELDVSPQSWWAVRSEFVAKGLLSLMVLQGGVLAMHDNTTDSVIHIETPTAMDPSEPVIVDIPSVVTVAPEAEISSVPAPPMATSVLPAEVTQPACVTSPILWLPDTVSRWHPYTEATAQAFGYPSAMQEMLMIFETLGDPTAVSDQDAVGLVQILQTTAVGLAEQVGIEQYDLTDPSTNIYLSGRYIRNVLDSGLVDLGQGFTTEVMRRVAIAYHGGQGALEDYLLGGMDILGPKTRRYAERISQAWDEQALPASQALNDLLQYPGPQERLAHAAAVGTPPC